MVLWRRRNLHPPPGGSGTGSLLLHYFSTNRVDSRGLRRTPVDSTAADKRLHSNVLDHKLRVVSHLPKHARTGSTPCPPGCSSFLGCRRRAVRPLHIRKNDKRGGRQDVHLPEYRGFGPLQQRYWGTPAT